MSDQYCLFDEERAGQAAAPTAETGERVRPAWRGPMRGMRFLKIGLADRSSIVVETALSMFELSNELRQKAKVALTLADGRGVEVKSLDVACLENVYSVPI